VVRPHGFLDLVAVKLIDSPLEFGHDAEIDDTTVPFIYAPLDPLVPFNLSIISETQEEELGIVAPNPPVPTRSL
jgi:hypothetical protein